MNRRHTEVVWVKDQYRLIDAESYERVHATGDGRWLAPGYYIADWPQARGYPDFLDGGVEFTGPYASRKAAEAALERPEVALRTA